MTKNTRVHARVQTDLDASYRLEGSQQWLKSRVANISAGGVGLLTEQPIEPMTAVAGLRFALPDSDDQDRQLEVNGLVLHCQSGLGTERRSYLSGIHLVGLNAETFRTLQEFVWASR